MMFTLCTHVAGLRLEVTQDGIHVAHSVAPFFHLLRVVWLEVLNFLFITTENEIDWCVAIALRFTDRINKSTFDASTHFEMKEFFAWSEFGYDATPSTVNGIVDSFGEEEDEAEDRETDEFLNNFFGWEEEEDLGRGGEGNTFVKIRNLTCGEETHIFVSGNAFLELAQCTFEKNLTVHLTDTAKVMGCGSMIRESLLIIATGQSICSGLLALGGVSEFQAKDIAKISVSIECPVAGRYTFAREQNLSQIWVAYTENSLCMKWRRSIQSREEVWEFRDRRLDRLCSVVPFGKTLDEHGGNSNTNDNDDDLLQYTLRHENHQVVEEKEEKENTADNERSSSRTQMIATRRRDGFLCVICCEKSVNVVLWPCNHACMCCPCAERYFNCTKENFNYRRGGGSNGNGKKSIVYPKCPLCRAPIKHINVVFFS